MYKKLKEAVSKRNRSIVTELVRSDFKLRYQGSVLGYLWSLLRPLMLFGVLYVVFTKVIKVGVGIPHYPAYLLLGLVLWTFFVEATMSGMNAITGRGDMIRKVSIPKYTIVISTTASAFVNFFFNMIVVVIFMILGHVAFRSTLIFVPFFIAELIIFCIGVSFLLATLYVKYRDFSHIWEVSLQVLFYATPIIYSLAIVPARLRKLASLNPLTQIFQDMRSVMITPQTLTTKQVFNSELGRLIPFLIVVAVAVLGAWYFRRSSRKFAEEL
jgi:ABC-2 type transport system permease protein